MDILVSKLSNRSHTSLIAEKVFLTRQNLLERTPANLTMLIQEVSKKGYMKIDVSKLLVSEQVMLFRQVKEIVAIGGASLTNLVFYTSETKVEVLSLNDKLTEGFWNNYAEILKINVVKRTLTKSRHHKI